MGYLPYYLIREKRLKLREEDNNSELIYYIRKNTPEPKDSRYYIFHLNKHFVGVVKFLLGLFFGIKKVVEKERNLYIYKNTRMHLDKVKDLGEFLELETVVKNEDKYAEYQFEQKEIIDALKLNEYLKIACSYSDMKA